MKMNPIWNLRVKAVATVEASFIVPMVTFVIIAMLCFIFYVHDASALQMIAERKAEGLLWERKQDENPQEALVMAKVSAWTASQDQTLIGGILGTAFSSKTVTAEGKAKVSIPVFQSRLWAGMDSFDMNCRAKIRRYDYRQDWLKALFLDGLLHSHQ